MKGRTSQIMFLSEEKIEYILHEWNGGNSEPLNQLFSKWETPLKEIIRKERKKWNAINHLSQTTEIFNEIFQKMMAKLASPPPEGMKRNFRAVAGILAMRTLVDMARRSKEGRMVDIDDPAHELEAPLPGENQLLENLALKKALGCLAMSNPILAALVNLHMLQGYTLNETADMLQLARGGMSRLKKEAKKFLAEEMVRASAED